MRVGVPREIKPNETRVALTPTGAAALALAGHEVVLESGAGSLSAFPDSDYEQVGVTIGSADDAWDAPLVLKVKEPVPEEYGRLSDNTLFTFLHLAANVPLAKALCEAGTTGVSYDTVQLADGSLPLLAPMSEVAGRLSVLAGAYHLLSSQGGRGVLLSGVPGVPGAKVVVLGAGIAGSNAVGQAVAMGADVTVLDLSVPRLREMDARFSGKVRTVASTPASVEAEVLQADLVIGAVLVPGHRAPMLVSHEMVERMRPGSVLVDIAIDQGGCFEDSRPTTHAEPTFRVGGSLMYCVANMPGAVGSTATRALTNVTLPYVLKLASGTDAATAADAALAKGVNVAGGRVVHPAVAEAMPELA